MELRPTPRVNSPARTAQRVLSILDASRRGAVQHQRKLLRRHHASTSSTRNLPVDRHSFHRRNDHPRHLDWRHGIQESVGVPLSVLRESAEDAQIRAEIAKQVVGEWLDCPDHADTAHSLNVYPFANILRETWLRSLWRFVRDMKWHLIGCLLFCLVVEGVAVWAIYHAFVGW